MKTQVMLEVEKSLDRMEDYMEPERTLKYGYTTGIQVLVNNIRRLLLIVEDLQEQINSLKEKE